MPKRFSDPIDRIVDLVLDAQAEQPLLPLPEVRALIARRVTKGITAEFRRWYEAECMIKDLELQEKMRESATRSTISL